MAVIPEPTLEQRLAYSEEHCWALYQDRSRLWWSGVLTGLVVGIGTMILIFLIAGLVIQ